MAVLFLPFLQIWGAVMLWGAGEQRGEAAGAAPLPRRAQPCLERLWEDVGTFKNPFAVQISLPPVTQDAGMEACSPCQGREAIITKVNATPGIYFP